MAYTNYRLPTTIFEDFDLLNKEPLQILLTLGRFHNSEQKIAYPSSYDIADLIHKDPGNVRRGIHFLSKNGFIIEDTFKNMGDYPIYYNGFYKSNAKFYILPDFLILDIEISLNKKKVDSQAFTLLKKAIDLLQDRVKLTRKRVKMTQKSVNPAQLARQNQSVAVSNHVSTLLNYYNELLQNKLEVIQKLDHKTNQIIYNISIKNSFNKPAGQEQIFPLNNRFIHNQEEEKKELSPASHLYLPPGLLGDFLKKFDDDFIKTKDHLEDLGYTEFQIQEAQYKLDKLK